MPNRRARDYDLSPFFLYHVDSRPVIMVSAIYLFMHVISSRRTDLARSAPLLISQPVDGRTCERSSHGMD